MASAAATMEDATAACDAALSELEEAASSLLSAAAAADIVAQPPPPPPPLGLEKGSRNRSAKTHFTAASSSTNSASPTHTFHNSPVGGRENHLH